ncbi:RNase A-like domain-containing protein [Streptomyces sp. NPDC090025]|uniref:RNase A-like domain-containing protein n=1 Tax=Streptomyces sp. NPDC090025 TaxID=3365922 RepID=UPI003833E643
MSSPWTGPGTIDVQPLQLYQVSAALAVEQQSFHRALTQFLDVHTWYAKVGGSGTDTAAFATAYAEVVALLMEVHGKAVVAIGGAAVGFTTTANNFGQADAATHPGNPPFTPQPPPVVIDRPPTYPLPPPFGVRDGNPVDDFLDVFDGGIAGDLMREVVEAALRTGRALEILPLPDYLKVNDLSQAWLPLQTGIGMIQGQLQDTINMVTNHENAEWHIAMRQFVSSLWGTTAWGKNTVGLEWGHKPPTGPGTSMPVFAVLSTTAQLLAQYLREYAEAAEAVRRALREILHTAFQRAFAVLDLSDIKRTFKNLWDRVKKLTKGLLAAVLLNIDTGKVNEAVDIYESKLRELTQKVKNLMDQLREASIAVPTFQAETARAEAYASRSLFEFDRSLYPLNAQSRDPNNHFGLDLASMEWATNPFQPPNGDPLREGKDAHTIDRHVGLTPEQLKARVRDQGVDASAFPDLQTAEKAVQAALNDQQNITIIETWMNKQKQKVANGTFSPGSAPELNVVTLTDVTGSTISKADFDASGFAAQPVPVHSAKVILAYSPESGTFYVRTAFPKAP